MLFTVVKQQATFKDIKAKLYTTGITFSLRHLAHLCITVNGDKHLFNTPEVDKIELSRQH